MNSKQHRFVCPSSKMALFLYAFAACFIVMCLAIAVPILYLYQSDQAAELAESQSEAAALENGVSMVNPFFVQAVSVAEGLRGVVLSNVKRIPPLEGSVSDRVEGQSIPSFSLAAGYFASMPDSCFRYQTISPGGVVMDVHPYDDYKTLLMLDLLDPNEDYALQSPTPVETMQSYAMSYVGPRFFDNMWELRLRLPIYTPSDFVDKVNTVPRQDLFWGFVTVCLNITGIIDKSDVRHFFDAVGMDYVIYTTQQDGKDIILSTSLPSQSPDTIAEFIGKSSCLFDDGVNFHISVKCRTQERLMNATMTSIIVFSALLGTFILFAIASVWILLHTHQYDGRPYAPKLAPFAVLTIGPCCAGYMPTLNPVEMTDVFTTVQRVLDKAMAAHHAYPIAQLHPYTSSYTTRSLDAAVHMALSVLEEMQRHPVHIGRCRALSEDKGQQMLLSCAVHWCRDATVLLKSSGGGYRYDGPDMVAASQMWPLCAPNVVTISEEAKHVARLMQGVVVEAYSAPNSAAQTPICGGREESCVSDQARPVKGLYTITDPASFLLQAARNAATRARLESGSECTTWASPDGSVMRSYADMFTSPNKNKTAIRRNGDTTTTTTANNNNNNNNNNDSGDLNNTTNDSSVSPSMSTSGDNLLATVTTAKGDSETLDGIASVLMTPALSSAAEARLRTAFTRQAVYMPVSYDSVRTLVYLVYSSMKILFQPLAAPERENIYHRLVVAFGVPQRCIVEHLAARCTLHYLQTHEEEQIREHNQRECGKSYA